MALLLCTGRLRNAKPGNYLNPYKFIHWVKRWDQKDKGLGMNHCKCNMEDEEGFNMGREVFLASVLGKTEYICQNYEGEGAAEGHAKVIDQNISINILVVRPFQL